MPIHSVQHGSIDSECVDFVIMTVCLKFSPEKSTTTFQHYHLPQSAPFPWYRKVPFGMSLNNRCLIDQRFRATWWRNTGCEMKPSRCVSYNLGMRWVVYCVTICWTVSFLTGNHRRSSLNSSCMMIAAPQDARGLLNWTQPAGVTTCWFPFGNRVLRGARKLNFCRIGEASILWQIENKNVPYFLQK